jgi:hypothetical protein
VRIVRSDRKATISGHSYADAESYINDYNVLVADWICECGHSGQSGFAEGDTLTSAVRMCWANHAVQKSRHDALKHERFMADLRLQGLIL